MKSLVVGGTPYQTTHVAEWLESIGHKVNVLNLTENFVQRPIKNHLSLSAIENLQRALFYGENSRRGFSHYFIFFHQSLDIKIRMISTILLLIIGYYGRQNPFKSRRFRRFIDRRRTKKSSLQLSYNYIFFTGNLSTSEELRVFYAAHKLGISTVYTPYSWDSPFGKLYRPTYGFCHSFAWGDQMKDEMRHDPFNFFGSIHIFPSPRLRYLTRLNRKLNSKQFTILAAPSLKPNSEMFESLILISKVCIGIYGRPKIILRPHPFSFNWGVEEFERTLQEFADVEVDSAYRTRDNDYAIGTFRVSHRRLEESLIRSFEIADLVVTEAGTLTAEALTRNLRVISLMNNYKNKTLRVHAHFDHFSYVMNDRRILSLFSLTQAEEKLEEFLKIEFKDSGQKISKLPRVIDFSGWETTPAFLNGPFFGNPPVG